MSGLLERALSIRKRIQLKRPGQEGQQLIDDESGITVEEKEKILAAMDAIIASNRLKIDSETFSFKPKRSSAKLPILINLVAVLVMLGGGFLLFRLFNQREALIVSDSASVATAEGKLLQALKEESEEKLSEKEQQIAEIQGQLAQIEQERAALESGLEEQIQAREAELQRELAALLEEERQRLQARGIAESEIEARLADFEAEKAAEYETQLTALRQEAEAELEEKEVQMREMEDEYRSRLETARTERSELLVDLEAREEELRQQLREQESTLASEKSQIEARLEGFQRQKERENLILDQINAYYRRINREIGQLQYGEALADLETLEEYLADPGVSSLPVIETRKIADLLVIESLRSLINSEISRAETGPAETGPSVAEKAAALLAAVEELSEQGTEHYREGNLIGARDIFLQVLEQIPAVHTAFKGVEAIRMKRREENIEDIRRKIDQAGSLFQAGNYRQSMTLYTEVITDLEIEAAAASEIVKTIQEAGFRLRGGRAAAGAEAGGEERKQIQALEAKLSEFENRREEFLEKLEAIERQLPAPGPETAGGDDRLIELLEAKITLREVLLSEPVRSQYPTLYEDIETYFEALGKEKLKESSILTINDLSLILEVLDGRDHNIGEVEDIWGKYRSPGERAMLRQFIENLAALYK